MEESRQVPKDEALKYKDDFEFDLFLETSAKTGYNTQELFIEAAKLLYKDYTKYRAERKKNIGEALKTDNNKQKKKGCCS